MRASNKEIVNNRLVPEKSNVNLMEESGPIAGEMVTNVRDCSVDSGHIRL